MPPVMPPKNSVGPATNGGTKKTPAKSGAGAAPKALAKGPYSPSTPANQGKPKTPGRVGNAGSDLVRSKTPSPEATGNTMLFGTPVGNNTGGNTPATKPRVMVLSPNSSDGKAKQKKGKAKGNAVRNMDGTPTGKGGKTPRTLGGRATRRVAPTPTSATGGELATTPNAWRLKPVNDQAQNARVRSANKKAGRLLYGKTNAVVVERRQSTFGSPRTVPTIKKTDDEAGKKTAGKAAVKTKKPKQKELGNVTLVGKEIELLQSIYPETVKITPGQVFKVSGLAKQVGKHFSYSNEMITTGSVLQILAYANETEGKPEELVMTVDDENAVNARKTVVADLIKKLYPYSEFSVVSEDMPVHPVVYSIERGRFDLVQYFFENPRASDHLLKGLMSINDDDDDGDLRTCIKTAINYENLDIAAYLCGKVTEDTKMELGEIMGLFDIVLEDDPEQKEQLELILKKLINKKTEKSDLMEALSFYSRCANKTISDCFMTRLIEGDLLKQLKGESDYNEAMYYLVDALVEEADVSVLAWKLNQLFIWLGAEADGGDVPALINHIKDARDLETTKDKLKALAKKLKEMKQDGNTEISMTFEKIKELLSNNGFNVDEEAVAKPATPPAKGFEATTPFNGGPAEGVTVVVDKPTSPAADGEPTTHAADGEPKEPAAVDTAKPTPLADDSEVNECVDRAYKVLDVATAKETSQVDILAKPDEFLQSVSDLANRLRDQNRVFNEPEIHELETFGLLCQEFQKSSKWDVKLGYFNGLVKKCSSVQALDKVLEMKGVSAIKEETDLDNVLELYATLMNKGGALKCDSEKMKSLKATFTSLIDQRALNESISTQVAAYTTALEDVNDTYPPVVQVLKSQVEELDENPEFTEFADVAMDFKRFAWKDPKTGNYIIPTTSNEEKVAAMSYVAKEESLHPAGLTNEGATCWVNAAMQTIRIMHQKGFMASYMALIESKKADFSDETTAFYKEFLGAVTHKGSDAFKMKTFVDNLQSCAGDVCVNLKGEPLKVRGIGNDATYLLEVFNTIFKLPPSLPQTPTTEESAFFMEFGVREIQIGRVSNSEYPDVYVGNKGTLHSVQQIQLDAADIRSNGKIDIGYSYSKPEDQTKKSITGSSNLYTPSDAEGKIVGIYEQKQKVLGNSPARMIVRLDRQKNTSNFGGEETTVENEINLTASDGKKYVYLWERSESLTDATPYKKAWYEVECRASHTGGFHFVTYVDEGDDNPICYNDSGVYQGRYEKDLTTLLMLTKVTSFTDHAELDQKNYSDGDFMAQYVDGAAASKTAKRPASKTAKRPASKTAKRPASKTAKRPASATPTPLDDTAASATPTSTELHRAIENNDLGVITELLNKDNSLLDMTDEHGHKPLMVAVNHSKEAVVRLLFESDAKPDTKDNGGNNALAYAKTAKMVELLVENGVDIDNQNDEGETCLHLFVKSPKDLTEPLRAVCKAGADLEKQDYRSDKPLMVAVSHSKEAVVRLLFEYGATPKTTDRHGNNALAYAKTAKMVELLVENGVDIDNQNAEGETCSHLFVKSHNNLTEPLRAVCESGANLLLKNKSGKTPSSIPKKEINGKTADLIKACKRILKENNDPKKQAVRQPLTKMKDRMKKDYATTPLQTHVTLLEAVFNDATKDTPDDPDRLTTFKAMAGIMTLGNNFQEGQGDKSQYEQARQDALTLENRLFEFLEPKKGFSYKKSITKDLELLKSKGIIKDKKRPSTAATSMEVEELTYDCIKQDTNRLNQVKDDLRRWIAFESNDWERLTGLAVKDEELLIPVISKASGADVVVGKDREQTVVAAAEACYKAAIKAETPPPGYLDALTNLVVKRTKGKKELNQEGTVVDVTTVTAPSLDGIQEDFRKSDIEAISEYAVYADDTFKIQEVVTAYNKTKSVAIKYLLLKMLEEWCASQTANQDDLWAKVITFFQGFDPFYQSNGLPTPEIIWRLIERLEISTKEGQNKTDIENLIKCMENKKQTPKLVGVFMEKLTHAIPDSQNITKIIDELFSTDPYYERYAKQKAEELNLIKSDTASNASDDDSSEESVRDKIEDEDGVFVIQPELTKRQLGKEDAKPRVDLEITLHRALMDESQERTVADICVGIMDDHKQNKAVTRLAKAKETFKGNQTRFSEKCKMMAKELVKSYGYNHKGNSNPIFMQLSSYLNTLADISLEIVDIWDKVTERLSPQELTEKAKELKEEINRGEDCLKDLVQMLQKNGYPENQYETKGRYALTRVFTDISEKLDAYQKKNSSDELDFICGSLVGERSAELQLKQQIQEGTYSENIKNAFHYIVTDAVESRINIFSNGSDNNRMSTIDISEDHVIKDEWEKCKVLINGTDTTSSIQQILMGNYGLPIKYGISIFSKSGWPIPYPTSQNTPYVTLKDWGKLKRYKFLTDTPDLEIRWELNTLTKNFQDKKSLKQEDKHRLMQYIVRLIKLRDKVSKIIIKRNGYANSPELPEVTTINNLVEKLTTVVNRIVELEVSRPAPVTVVTEPQSPVQSPGTAATADHPLLLLTPAAAPGTAARRTMGTGARTIRASNLYGEDWPIERGTMLNFDRVKNAVGTVVARKSDVISSSTTESDEETESDDDELAAADELVSAEKNRKALLKINAVNDQESVDKEAADAMVKIEQLEAEKAATLENSIQAAAEKLAAKKQQVAAEKQQVATEKAQLAAEKQQVDTAKAKLAAEKQQLAADQKQVATAKAEQATAKAELDKQKATIKTARALMDANVMAEQMALLERLNRNDSDN